MTLKSGTVSAVKNKVTQAGKDMYSLRVGDEWFNAFGNKTSINKGDVVEVDYKEEGQFKNIVSVKILEANTKPEKSKEEYIDENARLRRLLDLELKVFDVVIAGKIPLDQVPSCLSGAINLFKTVSDTKEDKTVEKPEVK